MSLSSAKPKLVIKPEVWDKIMFMSRNADATECSGFGMIEIVDGNFHVLETFLCEQINRSAETEMTADGIGKALFLARSKPGLFKFHWHSHVAMSTFWSGTDHDMIARNTRHGWFVHLVVNIRGEKRACFAQQDPFPLFLDEIDVVLEPHKTDEATLQAWRDEYSSNCRRVTYETTHWKGAQPVSLPVSQPYGNSLNRHADPKPNLGSSQDHLEADSGPAEASTKPSYTTDKMIEALENRKKSMERVMEYRIEALERAIPDSEEFEETKQEVLRYRVLIDNLEDEIETLYYTLLQEGHEVARGNRPDAVKASSEPSPEDIARWEGYVI